MRIVLEKVAANRQERIGEFTGEVVRLGAASGNDAVLAASDGFGAEDHQAEICVEGPERITLYALGRAIPTRLNARVIPPGEPALLRNGDEIRFGTSSLAIRFSFQPETVSEIFPAGKAPQVGPRTLRELVATAYEARQKVPRRKTIAFATSFYRNLLAANRRIKMLLAAGAGTIVVLLLFIGWGVWWIAGRVGQLDEGRTVAEVQGRFEARTVLVRTLWSYFSPSQGRMRKKAEYGTGFLLDAHGTVLTAKHVVQPWKYRGSYDPDSVAGPAEAREVEFAVWLPQTYADPGTGTVRAVVFFDPEIPTAKAVLERVAEDLLEAGGFHSSPTSADLALLRIESPGELGALAPVVIDKARKVRPGVDGALVLGYPRASQFKGARLHPAVTFERPRNLDANYIHMGGTVQPGLSGAPVFNADGELVGVVIALFAGETGMGCAVRAEHVAHFLGR